MFAYLINVIYFFFNHTVQSNFYLIFHFRRRLACITAVEQKRSSMVMEHASPEQNKEHKPAKIQNTTKNI